MILWRYCWYEAASIFCTHQEWMQVMRGAALWGYQTSTLLFTFRRQPTSESSATLSGSWQTVKQALLRVAPLTEPGFVMVPASLNLRGLFKTTLTGSSGRGMKLITSTELKQNIWLDQIRCVAGKKKMLKFPISVSQKFLVDAGRRSLADMRH